MSLRDLTRRLITILDRQAKHLAALTKALEAGRTAYVTLHPSELEASTAELEKLRLECSAVEASRQAILENIREALGLEVQPTGRELQTQAPADLKPALLRATEATRDAARLLHVENCVGANILEFARESQEAMSHELLKLEDDPNSNYNRNAKKIDAASHTGRLISGTA